MLIYLIRHAEPHSSNLAETETLPLDEANGLTTNGVAHAHQLAEFLRKDNAEKSIVSSPILRASQTAAILAKNIRTGPIAYDPRLAERRFNFSPDTSIRESRALQMAAFQSPTCSVAGGETVAEHRLRVVEWLREFLSLVPQDRSHLVVAHGGTIEHLLFHVLGVPIERMCSIYFDLPTAAYHLLDYSPSSDEWRIVATSVDRTERTSR